MKKIILSLCLVLCGSIAAWGQSFDRLWKDAEAAIAKDQPQSAMTIVDKVREKALAEDNDGQLLRAILVRIQLSGDVSPDSARLATTRLERAALTTPAEEEFAAVRALWLAAAGQVRLAVYDDTAATSRGRKLLQMALADFEPLGAARATDYLPLFTQGRDSRYYHDDLLSVVARPVLDSYAFQLEEKQQLAARLIAYYKGKGNREAALLATLDSIALSGQDNALNEKALRRTAEEYRNLALNVETYIALAGHYAAGRAAVANDSTVIAVAREGLTLYGKTDRADVLRNLIAEKEQPSLRFKAPRRTLYPGKSYSVTLEGRNVRHATLRFYRLDLTAADSRLINLTPKSARKIGRTLVRTLTHDFAARPAYVSHTDSLSLSLPESGVYLCEMNADGDFSSQEVLYVSRLLPLNLASQSDVSRVRLVDAETGAPFSEWHLKVYKDEDGQRLLQKRYDADANGEIALPRDDNWHVNDYYATAGDDAYLPAFGCRFAGMTPSGRKEPFTRQLLYTDRAIYRPGQTVGFSGIVYTQTGDEVSVATGRSAVITLTDARGKEVTRLTCITDSFGTLSGSFTLPASCLPGRYSLRGDRGGYTSVRVEEYKRPTFTVETDAPDTAYRLGDTIRISGKAETYTGLPVAGGRVSFSVARQAFWFTGSDNGSLAPQTGETVTDSAGRFCIDIHLSGPADGGGVSARSFVRYNVSVDVTASNGETASASRTVMAAKRTAWLSTDWPASLCKEQPGRVTVSLLGNGGNDLGADVAYSIRRSGTTVADGTLRSGQAIAPHMVLSLPSGEYDLTLTAAGADTLSHHFLLFSEHDARPAGTDVLWQYVRHNANRDSALVIIGSPRQDVTLFYDLFSGDKRLESRTLCFSDSLLRFPLNWREEWGDGARACFAFVKDGEIHTVTTDVVRPKPDKRLTLTWSTFRSCLTPGQEETWRLRVTNPDGTPADASLMARLYDASLDAFATNPWRIGLNFNRQRTAAYWTMPYQSPLVIAEMGTLKLLKTSDLTFTQWLDRLFENRTYYAGNLMLDYSSGSSVRMMKATATGLVGRTGESDMMTMEAATPDALERENTADETATATTVSARTDFAETAFFYPALRTDADGTVELHFTLPQSLTSWNFTALAHTRGMSHARLDTTVVARKEFMVQPALPRFVRQGDRATFPVTLRNLSDKAVRGTLVCQLVDPETERVVKSLKQAFSLAPQGTATRTFELDADFAQPLLVCRITAAGGGFSDGEEHYLPVLADRVNVVRSLPFSMTGAGTLQLRLDTLWTGGKAAADRRLTVEMSSNPAWYAIAALPALANRSGESATGWATRYYAVTLADAIARQNPDIALLLADSAATWTDVLSRNPELKQTLLAETPWAAEATTEAERTAALRQLFDAQAVAAARYTALDHLKDLQQADGSWSWYPGMSGNAYITSEVALLLARLETFCSDRTAKARLDRAMKFLDDRMAADVTRMKQSKATSQPGETHLRYLYIRALRGMKPDATASYLLDRAVATSASATMYQKALLAVVLVKAGRTAEAADALKSLEEHTVLSAEMGRYFDTDRAQWSWRSYRIPTQTAAIEAFAAASPTRYAQTLEEMRLWLMQTKRTQMWETGRATADAVFALLTPRSADGSAAILTQPSQPLLYTLTRGRDIVGFNAPSQADGQLTAGYYCHTYTDDKATGATTATVRKQGSGLAWGSVVAQYTLPTAAVESTSKGLTLTRRFEVWRKGAWQPLANGDIVRTGERVRQVFTVTADRDYDFVSLKSARAACLEPRNPLSGYVWTGSMGCYRAVRDASTELFVEQLRKGTHTLTEEYVADRAGRYQCGTSRIQSLYAPEYGAQTPGFVLTGEATAD